MKYRIKFLKSLYSPFILVIAYALILARPTSAQVDHRYPRIFDFQFGTAPAEWYAKFDLIRGSYGQYSKVKEINPGTLTFYSQDWNVWDVGGKAPEEWYVRNSKGEKVWVGYGYLMDISNYCSTSNGKKYNDFLIDYTLDKVINSSIYDGVLCQGIWDHPYGTTDVDLDKDGINDWNEHGKSWLQEKWLAGLDKITSALVPQLKAANKLLILNSGRFHTFEWSTSNGLMLEHVQTYFYFSYFKKMYDNWMATAPKPHLLLFDAESESKNSFSDMRYLLTITLLGDGYFSFTDKKSGEHYYNKYYDEFDTDLGYPTSSALKLSNGCWVRFFDNGVSITNPSGSNQIVTDNDLRNFSQYDGPYFRFKGGQDPEVNNGTQFDQITLAGSPASIGTYGDGIILLKSPLTVVADIIIDDNDAATSPGSEPAEFKGQWVYDDGSIGSSYYYTFKPWKNLFKCAYTQPGQVEKTATYKPTIGVSGNYEVFEWHGYIGNDPNYVQEATNAPFTITYAHGATASGTINQSINYGKWNSLGTYYFEEGTNGNVKISNKDVDGIVMADAFKFVYKGDENDAIAPNEPTNLRSTNKTADSITLTWSAPQAASDGDVAVAYQVFRNNVLVGTPISNFYIDSGLSERTTYDYAIYAVDNVGNRSISAATGAFTTLADTIPPRIVSVRPLGLTSLDVLFSEPVEKASSEDIANYTIESNVTIFSAVLLDNLTTVHLTTSEHVIGAPYTLIVNNVKDRALYPNTIPPNSSFAYQGSSGDSVSISIAADNEYELYINGELIGSGNNWKSAQTYSVPSIAGRNVIAVKAVDTGGKGGLVAEIDFKGKHFVSDESWKVSTVEQPNWESVTFDDVLWPKATSYGLHGVALPWAQYSNVSGISTTSNVKWIWSSDSENDNVVYFRFTINAGGDTTPPNPPTGVTVKTY